MSLMTLFVCLQKIEALDYSKAREDQGNIVGGY
jgi:hypothetical protein